MWKNYNGAAILFLERKRIKKNFKFETRVSAVPGFLPGNDAAIFIGDYYYIYRGYPDKLLFQVQRLCNCE